MPKNTPSPTAIIHNGRIIRRPGDPGISMPANKGLISLYLTVVINLFVLLHEQ